MKTHSLIIGGTRGLGREVARILASRGGIVSVVGRHDPNPGDKSASSVSYWVCDVSKQADIDRTLSEIVKTAGKVNNVVFLQRFKGEGDKWHGEMDISLTATKNVIESLENYFSETRDNSIVIISSIADQFISESQPVGYHVAKAGLCHLVRYYAVKLGKKGIRVNCVSPCTLVKEENKEFYSKNERLQGLFNTVIPLGRMGTSTDSAKVVAFLCSSEASFVTGQTITVDGGVSLLSQEALARQIAGI